MGIRRLILPWLLLAGSDGLRIRSSAALESTEKAQFVDQLLMAVLQMLLGNSGSTTGQTAATTVSEGETELLPQEDTGTLPAGTDSAAAEAGLMAGQTATSSGTSSLITASANSWPANGDEMLQAALTSQENSQKGFNQQVEALKSEIDELKALNQNVADNDTLENAIQLTIKYPGESAKVPPPPPAVGTPTEEAIGTEETFTNPLELHVPLVVVEPLQPDFHQILLKTMKEAQRANSETSLTQDLQQELQMSPEERLRADVTAYKNAAARAAFFQKDLLLSQKRVATIEGGEIDGLAGAEAADADEEEVEEEEDDEEEEEEEEGKKKSKKKNS